MDREQQIKQLMEHSNMSREEAEFAVAVDEGDSPGDVIDVEDNDDSDSD